MLWVSTLEGVFLSNVQQIAGVEAPRSTVLLQLPHSRF